jgi:hypothetical protein
MRIKRGEIPPGVVGASYSKDYFHRVPSFSSAVRRSVVENDGIPSNLGLGAMGVMHALA